MSVQPQFQPQFINHKSCLDKGLFFSPFRFCGRQWMWIKSDSKQISEVALKVLATPFLVGATLLTGIPAAIGALIFPPDGLLSTFEYRPPGDLNLLRRDISNDQVAEIIRETLSKRGCECSVKVRS